MRLAVFVIVFAVGALVSAAWTDDLTICPSFRETDAYHVDITAWPPFALKCTVEHQDGSTTTASYVPWWEWLCVALCALGVASIRLSVPRLIASIGLILLGLAGWFFGAP